MDRPPAPPEDRGDPALRPVRLLVEEHLALPASTWTVGTPGAVARFARDADEPARRGPNSVVTERGGLRVVLPDDAVAFAYETPAARDPLWWHQTVAFCVPEAAPSPGSTGAARTTVTELGPDTAALRPQDTAAVLFDLGLGLPATDVLVRAADPAALAVLRTLVGRDALDPELGLGAALAAAVPHVVVATAAGRIEVFGRSPGPTPGPHLRLRPERVRAGVEPPPHVPLPAGWTAVLRLHPPHPAGSADGRPIPFDAGRHAAFQALLDEYGDPVLGVVAAQVTDAVRALRGPAAVTLADDPRTRAAVAVVLRRLALTDGTSGTLAAWRSRWGSAAAATDDDA